MNKTVSQWIQMLELAEKNLKTVIIAILWIQSECIPQGFMCQDRSTQCDSVEGGGTLKRYQELPVGVSLWVVLLLEGMKVVLLDPELVPTRSFL